MFDDQRRTNSRFGRLFSLEGTLAAFGIFSIGSGVFRGELMPVFWGVIILTGLGILLLVRRRDWKSHWEAMERRNSSRMSRSDSEPPVV